MSWIKIDSTLAEKPQVRTIARAVKLDRFSVTGRLVAFWGWADKHLTDGNTMLTHEDVDDICGKKGFAQALCDVGWLAEKAGILEIVRFHEHNGETAKRRADVAKNVARCKAKKALEVIKGESKSNQEAITPGLLCDNLEKEYKENTLLTECTKERRPGNADEVQKVMTASPNCGLTGQELEDCAASFLDTMESRGWCDAQNVPVRDWRAAARRYLTAWQNNHSRARRGAAETHMEAIARRRSGCGNTELY